MTYTHDSRSNLLTVVDANTNTENTYDDLNRLTVTTDKTYTPNKTIICPVTHTCRRNPLNS